MLPSIIHGNLIQTHRKGILILGKPGIGKSKMTLDFLDRGSFFISDDVVLIAFDPLTQKWVGSRPELQARMHVRNLGFLDINQRYPNQILPSSPIDFVIELKAP
jgi:serine kinase of HPr protein (carbohydrate metabolism regulator)